MTKYRLEEAQDGFWRISEEVHRNMVGGETEVWWDVIVAPTQRSNWIHKEYAEMVSLEDAEEREFAAERIRWWEVKETNE